MAQNTALRRLGKLVGALVVLGLVAFAAFHIFTAIKGDSEPPSSPPEEQVEEQVGVAVAVPIQSEQSSADRADAEEATQPTAQDEAEAESQSPVETTPSTDEEESSQDAMVSLPRSILEVDAQTLLQAQDHLDDLFLYIKGVLANCLGGHQDLALAADNLFTSETAQNLGITVVGDISAEMWLEDETLDISDEERLVRAKILIGYAVNEIQRAEHTCNSVSSQETEQVVVQESQQSSHIVRQDDAGDDSDAMDLDSADGEPSSRSDATDVVALEDIEAQLQEVVKGRFLLVVRLLYLIESDCFRGDEEAISVIREVVPIVANEDDDLGSFAVDDSSFGEVEDLILKSGGAVNDGDLVAAQEFADAATSLLHSASDKIDSVLFLDSCADVMQP